MSEYLLENYRVIDTGNVTAQEFRLVPLTGPGGDAGMQRESGRITHRVREWVVWSTAPKLVIPTEITVS